MIGERGVMQETMFLVSASSAPNHLLRATDRSLSTYSRHHASLRPFLEWRRDRTSDRGRAVPGDSSPPRRPSPAIRTNNRCGASLQEAV
jgi:hypothetical protein